MLLVFPFVGQRQIHTFPVDYMYVQDFQVIDELYTIEFACGLSG